MGFMDKVKSTVQDVTDSVSKTIDNEKVDSKMREEKRKVDSAYQEIGEIVVKCMMSGQEFDVSMVSSQYSKAIESMQAITDYNKQRTEPSSNYEKYMITDNYVMPASNSEAPKPVPKPEPEPEPQPAVEAPKEEEKIEAPAESKEDDYSDWVEVSDDKFLEDEPEQAQSQQAEQPKASEPAPQQSSDEGSSPLSRMQSYKSNNYQGDNINKN